MTYARFHARRVVGENASHHRGAGGCGVGSYFVTVWFQTGVEPLGGDSRLEPDFGSSGAHLIIVPARAELAYYAGVHGLSAERCAAGAEGDANAVFGGHSQQLSDFVDSLRADNGLRFDVEI